MIPGKIFLESIEYHKEGPPAAQLKLNLVLNTLLYDELKLYHIKYLCLTPADTLTLEIIENDTQALLAATGIHQPYQLIA